jgi:Spy/CpxP family protein refolding chaperone
MTKPWMGLLAVLLVFTVSPVLAQQVDIDDEEMIALVADQDPGATAAAQEMSQRQGPPGERPDSTRPGYGPGAGGWHHGAGWGGAGSYLNLSKDQTDKMRDLWKRYYLDTRSVRFDLMAKRVEMLRIFTDPRTNTAALLTTQNQLSALREKLANRRAQAMIEWRGLLTPEQIEKLDLMMLAHQRMRMMGGGMGIGGGGMMGGGR